MKTIVRALLCVLFLLITPAKASEYSSNFVILPAIEREPNRVALWKSTPTVVVCKYAPVTEEQIHSAVTFWEKLGHLFYATQYNHDPLNKCSQTSPVGYIIVRLVAQGINLSEESLAVTHFYVDLDTNKIDWAIIYLRNEVRETVLEHEIGHALGYLHYDKINHLMNSKWTQGGWDVEGLKYR